MPSQFFGLNIAASALNAFQASVNTAANNVSNVQTKGYSKQVTNKEAGEGMRVNAKYGTTGTGTAIMTRNTGIIMETLDCIRNVFTIWNRFRHILQMMIRKRVFPHY